jgi:L-asparaginase/beta-aspartyl-peptidase (threonine type)
MISHGIVVHGGAGSPSYLSDGCKFACESAYCLLDDGKSALDAVVEAARILEDDGRFNAGTGSALRLDGKTIEMDASVMDSEGNVGIVIAIRNVKNPILVARAVMGTPHVALAGEGATLFAKKRGFEHYYQVSQHAIERFQKVKNMIREGRLGEEAPRWEGCDVRSLWNFDTLSYIDIFCDTIGAVAIDKHGFIASANSTGGFSPMMLGRVGDSPMIGCGFYAGTACAISATGMGEEIIKRMLAKTIYDMVSQDEDILSACRKGIDLFHSDIKAGVIGISRSGYAVASNIEMASYVLVKEG